MQPIKPIKQEELSHGHPYSRVGMFGRLGKVIEPRSRRLERLFAFFSPHICFLLPSPCRLALSFLWSTSQTTDGCWFSYNWHYSSSLKDIWISFLDFKLPRKRPKEVQLPISNLINCGQCGKVINKALGADHREWSSQ